MSRLWKLLLALFFFSSGCSKKHSPPPAEVLDSSAEFTRIFAESLRACTPECKVNIVADLQLEVTKPDQEKFTVFLDNAFTLYRQTPSEKEEIIARYVSTTRETALVVEHPLDRLRILPVVKDRPWLEETHQALKSRGITKMPQSVVEDLNVDLVIVYAEDSPENLRYFTSDDLTKAGIERSALRALACENLSRTLPEIASHGENGFYFFTADGNYEASLLLLDPMWDNPKFKVKGEVVVAIPARDVLMVTGSHDPQGLIKMKEITNQVMVEAPYRLTSKLFVRREGRFQEFKEE